MNSEVAVIDVIDRILSEMLEDAGSRARVVAFFHNKYGSVSGVPSWENEGGSIATPAIATAGGVNSSGGWGWGGMP